MKKIMLMTTLVMLLCSSAFGDVRSVTSYAVKTTEGSIPY